MAGISVNWYTRLEQADDVTASPEVLDAIGRVLQLGPDEQRHLRRLGGHPAPEGEALTDEPAVELRMLLDAVSAPAVVFSACYDYLASNSLYEEVFAVDLERLAPHRRNGLWVAFMVPSSRVARGYDRKIAAALLAQFRFEGGRHSGNSRFGQIVSDLSASSPEFTAIYAEHHVQRTIYAHPQIVVKHPDVGPIRFRTIQFRPLPDPEQLLSVHLPEAETDVAALAALTSKLRDNGRTAPE